MILKCKSFKALLKPDNVTRPTEQKPAMFAFLQFVEIQAFVYLWLATGLRIHMKFSPHISMNLPAAFATILDSFSQGSCSMIGVKNAGHWVSNR